MRILSALLNVAGVPALLALVFVVLVLAVAARTRRPVLVGMSLYVGGMAAMGTAAVVLLAAA